MKVEELAKIANISQRALRDKAKKAFENNQALVIKDSRYKVSLDSQKSSRGKVYLFSKIEDKTIDTKLTQADKVWQKASQEKKQEALLKAQLISKWESRDKKLSLDKFIQTLPRNYTIFLNITKASFFRWLKIYRQAKEKSIPPSYALLDTRGGDRGTKKLTQDMENFIQNQILKKPHTKIKRVYEYLCLKFEDAPSYSTIERYIKRFKEKEAFIYAFASNPNSAMSKYRPAFGKMDENITYANQLWELDATPADIITADGKRLIISAAIDVYSRRVVLIIEESASFSTLSKLFRKAIKTLGIPDAVKTDNGKDYTSNNFSLMCQRLKINHVLVPPYSGYYKPHIERFFRTLSHELFEELEGYIGHNVAQREALQNQQTFEQKLNSIKMWQEEYKNGNEFAKRFALKQENRGFKLTVPLTKQELDEWCDRWLKFYENRLHRGINQKPIKRWESSNMPIKRVSDSRILDILVGLSTVKRVTKKGITIDKIVYTSAELWEFVGEQVIVLTDDELGKIYVYDTDYNYITTATSSEYLGKSRAEHIRAIKKFDKRVRKMVKLLEEIRAEQDSNIKELILEKTQELKESKEVGYEYKSEITKSITEALESNKEEVHEELKDNSIVPVIDKKPIFKTPYDRFVYELKHNCISKTTEVLKQRYQDSWEAAKKAAS